MQPGSGYRDPPARCPACATPMEPRLLYDAQIDVCPACKALWVDWYDGDLRDVAVQAAPLSDPVRPGVATTPAGGCPRCQSRLARERLRDTAASVFRCGDCGGALVPRSQFPDLLAWAQAEPEREGVPARGVIARLVAILRALID